MHVVVVGGGIVGTSCAYYLKKRGIQSTIVEKCHLACHSSGKAGGLLALDWNSGAVDRLARASFHLHEELSKELQCDIGYRRMNCIGAGASHGPSRNDQGYLDTANLGHPMGDHTTMAQVHPRRLTEALAEASGATVHIGKVDGVELDATGGSVRSVLMSTSNSSQLPCDAVVFAMGAWSKEVAGWFPSSPGLDRCLHVTAGPKYTSVVWDYVCEGNHHDCAAFLDSAHHVEIYPRSDESYACGCPGGATRIPDDPKDITPEPGTVETVTEEVRKVSPSMAGSPVKVSQACYLPVSGNGSPVIGPLPGVKNAYVACGLSCWGILNGPGTGKAIAEMIHQELQGRSAGGVEKETEDLLNIASAFCPGR